MRKFIKYILFGCTLSIAFLLASLYFIPKLNPYTYNFMSVLSLLTHGLVAINILLLLFWLLARKYLIALIPLAALLISWRIYSVVLAINIPATIAQSASKGFSVMSYNVRLLNLYGWSGKKDTRGDMIRYFQKENPSILCLQEFYSNNAKSVNESKGMNNRDAIKEACGYEYMAECNMYVTNRGKWGSILFSHYPILTAENIEINIQGNNLIQKAEIQVADDTISVYNIHLTSNRFSEKETGLVFKNKLPEFSNTNYQITKSILQKLMDNSVDRGLEADIISAALRQDKNPTIVCGDLNDLPSSYSYFKIRENWKDAFLEKGFGFGSTFRSPLPILRIDYLLYTPSLQLLSLQQPNLPYSDHNPLLAHFTMNKDTLANP
jgi:endonuclease/exonuclease/phosphatase family metal-dependent hydrolase